MSGKNVYNNDNTELLLTKIDSLIQKSRATRNRVSSHNNQKGGDLGDFVSLDTPVDNQRGGNMNGFTSLDTPVNNQRGGDGEEGEEGGEEFSDEPQEPFNGKVFEDEIITKEKKKDNGEGFDLEEAKADLEKAQEAISRFNMIGGGCGCGGEGLFPVHTLDCGSISYNRQQGSSNVITDLDKAIGSVDSLLKGF